MRYIIVTRVKGEDQMKKIEEQKHAADLVSLSLSTSLTLTALKSVLEELSHKVNHR